MTQNSYKRPPITEAVIEIRFKNKINNEKLRKAIKKARSDYANYDEPTSYSVDINVSNTSQADPKTTVIPEVIYRLSSPDMTQQLIIKDFSFLVSQLAPYNGWDKFFDRFCKDWKTWKKNVGYSEISRIGVRYINRLDIPTSGNSLKFIDYVNIFPKIPKTIGSSLSYKVGAQITVDELNSTLLLQSTVISSPLPNHTSIVIDVDISRERDVPQNDDSIYSFLEEVHIKKNEVFESCITDKSREIFNK